MNEQVAIQKLLIAKYEEIRSKNPRFSRRAFSKRLGLSAGAMSELFNGRRRVSVKLAEKIAIRLVLDPQERSELMGLFRHGDAAAPIARKGTADYLQLSADQFRIIGDWYHFAILTLMRTRRFKSDVSWIARRLGLSLSVAQSAVARLKRLRLVEQDRFGRLKRSKTSFRTTDDVADGSIRRAHFQYLEHARDALETLPVDVRDFTSLMLTLDPKKLPQAKELIRKFQDDFEAVVGAGPQPEVYQLCIQLFPLTKINLENDTGE